VSGRVERRVNWVDISGYWSQVLRGRDIFPIADHDTNEKLIDHPRNGAGYLRRRTVASSRAGDQGANAPEPGNLGVARGSGLGRSER